MLEGIMLRLSAEKMAKAKADLEGKPGDDEHSDDSQHTIPYNPEDNEHPDAAEQPASVPVPAQLNFKRLYKPEEHSDDSDMAKHRRMMTAEWMARARQERMVNAENYAKLVVKVKEQRKLREEEAEPEEHSDDSQRTIPYKPEDDEHPNVAEHPASVPVPVQRKPCTGK